MFVSVFDLFKIGVGPSSSHTMGPMKAANRFVAYLDSKNIRAAQVNVSLYGSLALTGRGHATDRAVVLGLAGMAPERLNPDAAEAVLHDVRTSGRLPLGGSHAIQFEEADHILWEGHIRLPGHSNALEFRAFGQCGELLAEKTYFSVGGGFVCEESELGRSEMNDGAAAVPYRFGSASELLQMGEETRLPIAKLMLANELTQRSDAEIRAGLNELVSTMYACIDRGIAAQGILPGGLKVQRRAHQVWQRLVRSGEQQAPDPLQSLDWVKLWALAVNEENAAGGQVVTAPTNGAAGLLPAVLRYYDNFQNGTEEGRHQFLLTAAAIGMLYKRNASISGAEVGCQGEVGVACSMAAAGLAACLGANNSQVENAAEIAMEHNLGLTCDPIGGLVQIPCIERNAMGAVKAIVSARLAMLGDGLHSVSLDKVIATMKRTGEDMNTIYKETSLGGLAVNLTEC